MRLAAIQFLVCGLCSSVPMLIFESGSRLSEGRNLFTVLSAPDALIPVLYAGIFSCGVAYTLQIVGQKNVQPTLASLMMSFESVFCVLGGWWLLGEELSRRQLLGCALVFAAILLAQFGELRPSRHQKASA